MPIHSPDSLAKLIRLVLGVLRTLLALVTRRK